MFENKTPITAQPAVQSAIQSAFPLHSNSAIDTLHPAFMQAAMHVASCPNLHNAGRNVTQILTNLRKCGCGTLLEFKNARIERLVTAPRLKGKVLRPIVEAVHSALQNVELLLPETTANSPSEVEPKPPICISADSSIWETLYDVAMEEKCQRYYNGLRNAMNARPLTVGEFLEINPYQLCSKRKNRFGPKGADYIRSIQNRIVLITADDA